MKSKLSYQELDSTLLEYERLRLTGREADRFVIRAATQTGGTGRNEAHWHSPEGGLWLSFDLLHPSPVPSFPLYVGFCLHKLLCKLFPLELLQLKWPNDLYLDGAKLAGIICHYQPGSNRYLIGIGINTNVAKDEVLHQYNAAILSDHIGFAVSNSLLAGLLVQAVEADYLLLRMPENYLEYCNQWLWGRNRLAEVLSLGSSLQGRIAGISAQGSLLLQDSAGNMQQIAYGSLRILD